ANCRSLAVGRVMGEESQPPPLQLSHYPTTTDNCLQTVRINWLSFASLAPLHHSTSIPLALPPSLCSHLILSVVAGKRGRIKPQHHSLCEGKPAATDTPPKKRHLFLWRWPHLLNRHNSIVTAPLSLAVFLLAQTRKL